MKMTNAHYEVLKGRCGVHLPHYAALLKENIANDKIKDPERAALMYIFRRASMHQAYTPQEFDYEDAHILTAMRKILATYKGGIEQCSIKHESTE